MIRITGGLYRGRTLKTPSGEHTRPTQARLRQALFNSLQHWITDAQVLDLFAGSGGLGLEALSRGAARSVFVESHGANCRLIRENIQSLGVSEQAGVIHQPIAHALGLIEKEGPFELVLADPPYAENYETWLLNEFPWERILAEGGHFVLEWGKTKAQVDALPEQIGVLRKVREKEYGDSILSHYRRE